MAQGEGDVSPLTRLGERSGERGELTLVGQHQSHLPYGFDGLTTSKSLPPWEGGTEGARDRKAFGRHMSLVELHSVCHIDEVIDVLVKASRPVGSVFEKWQFGAKILIENYAESVHG